MNISKLIVAGLLSVGVCAAYAQAPDLAPGGGPGPRPSAEEREKRCQANPEKCAEIKARVEQRRAENQARRDEFRKKCEADPKACEEKKAQLREQREERREHRQERHQEMKERMQNAPRPPAK